MIVGLSVNPNPSSLEKWEALIFACPCPHCIAGIYLGTGIPEKNQSPYWGKKPKSTYICYDYELINRLKILPIQIISGIFITSMIRDD
jgi:hypothetical protein